MLSSSAADTASLDAGRAHDEAKAAFHLRLRAKGIRDLRVLRALERVPRAPFVPARYQSLAARDLAVPIACGQTLHEPWLVGRMIEALAVEPSHKVLEIGAGTGYASAILAQLADTIIAIERYQSLALAAQARLDALAVSNAIVAWGDGLGLPAGLGTFDRIIVHGLIEETGGLLVHLAPNGLLVGARATFRGQHVTRITRGVEDARVEVGLGPCRLQPLIPGLAALL